MKKICLTLLTTLIFTLPSFAKTIEVEGLSDFTTANPPKFYTIKVLGEIQLDKDITLKNGDIVHGKIVDVTDPKRLKRNATFSFVPTTINSASVKNEYPGRYTSKLNKGEIAKSAALTVGNHFVTGLSMGYHAIEGAVKNEEGNRLKSSAEAVYESSPVSYIEKGEEITINKNEIFYLNFKSYKESDEPNYEFTPLDEDKTEE